MRFLRLFFNAAGSVRPAPFVVAVIFVYAFGLTAQMLMTPMVYERAGLWPFAVAEGLLVWVWFALHAKRLRDAGRGIEPAQGIAAIYALAVVLLFIIAEFFLDGGEPGGSGLASRIVTFYFVHSLRPTSDPVLFLMLIGSLSIIIPPIFSIWAATRPSRAERRVPGRPMPEKSDERRSGQ
jgi:uncharacterized membrane protein YhaH (DUF805 family)